MTQTDLQQLACDVLDIDKLPQVFIHLKTGNTYLLTDVCLNCTNGQENIINIQERIKLISEKL